MNTSSYSYLTLQYNSLKKRYKKIRTKLREAELNYEGIAFDQDDLIRVALTNPLALHNYIKNNYPKQYYKARGDNSLTPILSNYPYQRLMDVILTTNPTGCGGWKAAYEYIVGKVEALLKNSPRELWSTRPEPYRLVYDHVSLGDNLWYLVQQCDLEEFYDRLNRGESVIGIATTVGEDIEKVNIYSWDLQ